MKKHLFAALTFLAVASVSAEAAMITTQIGLSETVPASQLLFDPQLGTLLDAEINLRIRGAWHIDNEGGLYGSWPDAECVGGFASVLQSASMGEFFKLNYLFETPVAVGPDQSLRVPVNISYSERLDRNLFTLSAAGAEPITWYEDSDFTCFTDYLNTTDPYDVIPTCFLYDGLLTITYTYTPDVTPVPEPSSALLLAAGVVSALFCGRLRRNHRY